MALCVLRQEFIPAILGINPTGSESGTFNMQGRLDTVHLESRQYKTRQTCGLIWYKAAGTGGNMSGGPPPNQNNFHPFKNNLKILYLHDAQMLAEIVWAVFFFKL